MRIAKLERRAAHHSLEAFSLAIASREISALRTGLSLDERIVPLRCRLAIGMNLASAGCDIKQWLPIECPTHEAKPSKYFLSTLPKDTLLNQLVSLIHHRWRIERDYQVLKRDFGPGHYEGRC